MSTTRVTIQWTDTAFQQLKELPPKVRRGLLDKADELRICDNPRTRFKPLAGALQNYYRMCYSRYRAVFCVQEEELASGDKLVHLKVMFVAVGKRSERSRDDVYRVAEKVVKYGLMDPKKPLNLADFDSDQSSDGED